MYDDAAGVCNALDAKLATYDQVEDAYKNGAEWCNYGWTDGQMALFPTQKATWEKGDDNYRQQCGRPGVNGGHVSNPYSMFGVNCYGVKPKPSAKDLAAMSTDSGTPVQTFNMADKITEAKVKYWKEHADTMLKLSSYNKNRWSEY
jgi:hypothetical protein